MGKMKEEHYHHHYNWKMDDFLKWAIVCLVVVLVTISAIRITENTLGEDRIVYEKCVDGCSKKHFLGFNVGADLSSTWVEGDEDGKVAVYRPTVNEFDRTDCMESCNEMYFKLK